MESSCDEPRCTISTVAAPDVSWTEAFLPAAAATVMLESLVAPSELTTRLASASSDFTDTLTGELEAAPLQSPTWRLMMSPSDIPPLNARVVAIPALPDRGLKEGCDATVKLTPGTAEYELLDEDLRHSR
jgi:hypothetical protein